MPDLIRIITAMEPALRNQSLESACAGLSLDELLRECAKLDDSRRHSENLYERVRALFFLYAIHRFHLPAKLQDASRITSTLRSAATEDGYHASSLPLHPRRHLQPQPI